MFHVIYTTNSMKKILLGKPTVAQLVRLFLAFNGTQRFIAVLTGALLCPYPGRNESNSCTHTLFL
jgi:hypothetical protein